MILDFLTIETDMFKWRMFAFNVFFLGWLMLKRKALDVLLYRKCVSKHVGWNDDTVYTSGKTTM